MIKDTDDKKIIFNHNKKFNTNQYEIRNQINNREIQINDETILHACITDITFEDDKITINFLSKDDLEFTYEISKEAETGEIPEYLQINETDIVQLAIKIFALEAYKVFMNDTTLPEAAAINELQAQITTLTNENETLSGQVETLTTEKGTLEGQVENLTTQLQNAPAPLADEVVQLAFDFDLSDLELVPVNFAGPSGQLAAISVKVQHTYSGFADKLAQSATTSWLGSMIELESFKVLGDAQTATSGTLQFNNTTGEVYQQYNISLSSGSYIDIPQDGLIPIEIKLKNKQNNKTITFTETYDTANSQFIGGGGITYNILNVDDTIYFVAIDEVTGDSTAANYPNVLVYSIINTTTGDTVTTSELGFTSRVGAAAWKNTTNNHTITYELYNNGTLCSDAQPSTTNTHQTNTDLENLKSLTKLESYALKVIVKDENDAILSTVTINGTVNTE